MMDVIGLISGLLAGLGIGFMLTHRYIEQTSDEDLIKILKERRYLRALKDRTASEVEVALNDEKF